MQIADCRLPTAEDCPTSGGVIVHQPRGFCSCMKLHVELLSSPLERSDELAHRASPQLSASRALACRVYNV